MYKGFLIFIFSLFFFILQGQNNLPIRLSDSINSSSDEYWPSLTADDSTMIFNRIVDNFGIKNEDFYLSTKDSLGNWSKAVPLSSLNTEANEGAQTLSADGRFMVFTKCNDRNGYGSCDLYYSIKIGEHWLAPRNLGQDINTKAWETQASLSADGTELYFVSNREGGKGGMDIWHSRLKGISEEGVMQWSSPTNLSINTKANEMSPFIHRDNQTLYFSSDGYTKEKQFDIYMSRKEKNDFSPPKNIGSPVNTPADEIGFIVNTAGTTAYFSSDRASSSKNLYSFLLPDTLRPKKVQILYGKVKTKKDSKTIFASVQLENINDSTNVYQTFTDPENGNYLACLPQETYWKINVKAEAYLPHSENIEIKTANSNFTKKDISLSPLEKGEKILLNNIFFETDEAFLQPESLEELQRIKQILENNPTLSIELQGHTDNQGEDQHNQQLSERRAKAVFHWLVKEGISEQRLSYKGYGATFPIATNATEVGRKQNRRTELKIINY